MMNRNIATASDTRTLNGHHSQTGAALVVSLVFLVVITIVAVASMRTTTMQERMAGNTRDRNIALQAAESAAREAELLIEGLASMGNFTGSGGLYRRTDNEPDYQDQAMWADGVSYATANASYGSYQNPRYFIKHHTTVTGDDGALNMSGYGDNKGTGDATIFRITSRGTGGGADTAEVILRSQYGRIF
jgi:type IV pilus assembly protein PilX